jgi:hypothetical protein
MLSLDSLEHPIRKRANYDISEITVDGTTVRRIQGDGGAIPVDLRPGEIAIVVHLSDCPRQTLFLEGRVLLEGPRAVGQLNVLGASGLWIVDLGGATDCVIFNMPRARIGNDTDIELASFEEQDVAMLGLTRSLAMSIGDPQRANALFTQSVVSAIMFHISEVVAGS